MSFCVKTVFLPALRVPFSLHCPLCTDFDDTIEALPSLSVLIAESSSYDNKVLEIGIIPLIKVSQLLSILSVFLGFTENEGNYLIRILNTIRRSSKCLQHQKYYNTDVYSGLQPSDLTCPLFNPDSGFGFKSKENNEYISSYDVTVLLYIVLLGGDRDEIYKNIKMLLCCLNLVDGKISLDENVIDIQNCKTSKGHLESLFVIFSLSKCTECFHISDFINFKEGEDLMPTLIVADELSELLDPTGHSPDEITIDHKNDISITRNIKYEKTISESNSQDILPSLIIENCNNCSIYLHGPIANVVLKECKDCKVVGPICQGMLSICKCSNITAHFISYSSFIVESKNVKMSCCVNTIPYSTNRSLDVVPSVSPLFYCCSDMYYIMAICGVYPEPSLGEQGIAIGAFGDISTLPGSEKKGTTTEAKISSNGDNVIDVNRDSKYTKDTDTKNTGSENRFKVIPLSEYIEEINPFDEKQSQANPIPLNVEQQKYYTRKLDMIRANMKSLELVDSPEVREELNNAFLSWLKDNGYDKELEKLMTPDSGTL